MLTRSRLATINARLDRLESLAGLDPIDASQELEAPTGETESIDQVSNEDDAKDVGTGEPGEMTAEEMTAEGIEAEPTEKDDVTAGDGNGEETQASESPVEPDASSPEPTE